jgi:phosphohistidine phosphatase
MLTLALLRHAKSSWGDPGLDDFDRPLNSRGLKAAPVMGRTLRDLDIKPNLILCSTARRTRDTLALAGTECALDGTPVRFEDQLYLASPDVLLTHLKALPDTVTTVLLIGHNPGLHSLALNLLHSGDAKSIVALEEKFPTCALAVFTFPATRWTDIGNGLGRLEHFITPRERA